MSVQITSPSLPDFEVTRNISRTESTSFQLPDALCASGSQSSFSPNDIVSTIVIQADRCVSVNAEVVWLATADTFLVIPERELGEEYIIASYQPYYHFSQFTISSTCQNTTVSMKLSNETEYNGTAYGPDEILTITMDRLQSLQFQSRV